jgi:hypothetical protein
MRKKKKRKKPPNPYKGLGSVLPRGLGSRSISYTGKGNDLGRPSLPRQEAQVNPCVRVHPLHRAFGGAMADIEAAIKEIASILEAISPRRHPP